MIEKCFDIMNWIIAAVVPLLIMGIFTAVFYRVFVCGEKGISPGKFCGYAFLTIVLSYITLYALGYWALTYVRGVSTTVLDVTWTMYAAMSLIIVLEATAAVIVEFRKD